jgi:hypothetical protein
MDVGGLSALSFAVSLTRSNMKSKKLFLTAHSDVAVRNGKSDGILPALRAKSDGGFLCLGPIVPKLTLQSRTAGDRVPRARHAPAEGSCWRPPAQAAGRTSTTTSSDRRLPRLVTVGRSCRRGWAAASWLHAVMVHCFERSDAGARFITHITTAAVALGGDSRCQ